MQETALRGISLIIGLTGSYIGRFLPQIMALLTNTVTAGRPAALKMASLQAWSLLSRALAKESPSQLSFNINQVGLPSPGSSLGLICTQAWLVEHG